MSESAMRPPPVLFVDRDGTLIEEPADNQVDRLDKLRLLPGVFAALSEFRRAGYRLVMVSNQDGLGSERYPLEHFEQVQGFLLRLFASQGIEFDAGFYLPAFRARAMHLPQAAHRAGDRLPATAADRP